jgi:acetyl esterase/lipase
MKRSFVILTYTLSIVLIISGCSGPQQKAPQPTIAPTYTPSPPTETSAQELNIVKSLVYANVSNRKTHLDIVTPIEDGIYPIAIIVHGSWVSKDRYQQLAEAIASHGFVVYNINVVHDNPYSQSIHRIVCAIKYARGTAEEFHGDPDRIVLIGHSDGAATGAVSALSGDDFGENCEMENESAVIQAFIGYEGAYEFATADYINNNPDRAYADHSHLEETDPELYQAINVNNHIGRFPEIKFRLLHGTYEDDSPHVDVTKDFYQTLLDAGYDVQLILVEGATHMDVIFQDKDAFSALIDQLINVIQ